jgi:anti-sigma factor RsiW
MKDRADAMTTTELTCRELVELVTDYLEDALPDHERMRFEDHLTGCTGCRRYLDQMRLTVRAAGHLREDDLSPAARDDLLTAFRTWKQTRPGG